jgi:hypothetical protein
MRKAEITREQLVTWVKTGIDPPITPPCYRLKYPVVMPLTAACVALLWIRMKTTAAVMLTLVLSGCAIEGVGFDGRVNAYRAAEQDSREYVALHMGKRDPAWYSEWCDVVRPHFQRMAEESSRVDRYCAAMQAQPENAQKIGQSSH